MSDETPQKPRSRLIVPESAEKPRTRLIAPAVGGKERAAPADETSQGGDADWPEGPVSVTPLAPPPAAAPAEEMDAEPPIGEAEQGEFTVIDEDTGETHTVPVKVSSMAPPPVALADPDPDALAEAAAEAERAAAQAAAEEAARQQAAYEAELAAYEQQQAAYEAAQQQAAYEAAQQQAAYEAAQQQAYYAAQQQQAFQAQGYGHQPHLPPRVPQTGGYGLRPGPSYGGMPMVVVGRGVPGWALVMIGLLFGFVMSVLAYKFTDFGKMIRPDEARPVDQSSVSDLPDAGIAEGPCPGHGTVDKA